MESETYHPVSGIYFCRVSTSRLILCNRILTFLSQDLHCPFCNSFYSDFGDVGLYIKYIVFAIEITWHHLPLF